MKTKLAKAKLIGAMTVFGTVGIFVRYIPLSSAAIAFCRGVTGMLFLLILMLLTGKKPSLPDIRRNLLILCLSGAAIGGNWILLFEAYRYTTVATATVCYYMAPMFVILASPLLGERLTLKKLLCVAAAMVGMVFVSGVAENGIPPIGELTGVLCGTGAALLYASVMLLNKKLTPISAYDKTIVQLGAAALVVFPYLLLTEGFAAPSMHLTGWILLAIVGILHTGIAYALYFGSMQDLHAQTIAIFSYLDPVLAILLSALLLKEPMGVYEIIGTVLILGSAFYSELHPKRTH